MRELCKSSDHSNERGFFWILKVVVVLAVLTAMSRSVPTQSAAEGRIQITLIKTGYGEGSGILFYEGQKDSVSAAPNSREFGSEKLI